MLYVRDTKSYVRDTTTYVRETKSYVRDTNLLCRVVVRYPHHTTILRRRLTNQFGSSLFGHMTFNLFQFKWEVEVNW